jgi:hypothetical protein
MAVAWLDGLFWLAARLVSLQNYGAGPKKDIIMMRAKQEIEDAPEQ